MPKIVTVESEELKYLREEIVKTFLKFNPSVRALSLNSYAGAYQELLNDMKERCPAYASEFSPKRLIKLYYFTDSEKCDYVQNPNFGVGFIEGCYEYIEYGRDNNVEFNKTIEIEDNQQNNLKTNIISTNRKRNYQIVTLIGTLFFIIILFAANYFKKQPKLFEDQFNDVGFKSLSDKGWQILWRNDTFLQKQPRRDFLALYTRRGDSWVKPHEKPYIDNLIYRKIESDCFEAIIKIDSFLPKQPSQQVGLIFFKSEEDIQNFVRFSCANGLTSKSLNGYHAAFLHNNIPIQYITTTEIGSPVWLYVQVRKSKYTFKIHTGFEWDAFGNVFEQNEIQAHEVPKFIGIYACHGISFNDNTLRNAETIPAYIDYFKINPLSCD